MKRKTLKFIACAAVMSLTLSVTACGGDDKTAETANVENVVDVDAEDDVDETEVEDEVEVEDDVDDESDDADDVEDETEDADDEAEDVDDEADAELEEEETEDDSDEYQTLEDYFNDPDIQSMFDSLIEAMGQDELAISYDVNGNEFIMTFQITDSSIIVDGMAEGLAAALDTQAAQFKTQAAQFDEVLGEEGASSVTVRYTDPDDNVLAEQTFTAD